MKASDIPTKPPEWSYWIDMKSVELIEAILLSVDIDPRFVPGQFKSRLTLRINIPSKPELTKRTEIALNHYGKYAFERYDLKQPVELKEFRRWAEQLQNPWVFPNGFPSAADEQIQERSAQAGEGLVVEEGQERISKAARWISEAQRIGAEEIAKHRSRDLHLNRTQLSQIVAKRLRSEEVFGTRKVPLEQSTVLRHALTREWCTQHLGSKKLKTP
jgi:hypothetical protein